MFFSTMLRDKRRYRQFQQRVAALPGPQRDVVTAITTYWMRTASVDATEPMLAMFDDVADLFEQSAISGSTIRDVVGDDPVAFAEDFKSNYGIPRWIGKEQQRLLDAVTHAEREAAQ